MSYFLITHHEAVMEQEEAVSGGVPGSHSGAVLLLAARRQRVQEGSNSLQYRMPRDRGCVGGRVSSTVTEEVL